MAGKIQLLPDRTANQIAAGEVVQRPASVVKELLENAIDAQATIIKLFIKNGGCTLVQVDDNGVGMNAFDARMCWERHATSKITKEDDLYNLPDIKTVKVDYNPPSVDTINDLRKIRLIFKKNKL